MLFWFFFIGQLPEASQITPVEVVRVPSYSEGIVFDRMGNAYISHGKFLSVISPDGKARIWAETGSPDGHKILADGTHLVCDESQHAVLHLDAKGKLLGKASAECDGKSLRGPNDLALDPNGGFYFTDPGDSNKEKTIGTVHYVDRVGKTHLVAGGLAYPNGIVLRPNGRELLVGESGFNRILSYRVIEPGKVGSRMVFAVLPTKLGDQIDNQPDGMCLDEEGNLYVAHYGMHQVQVLSPKGGLLRSYPAGNLTASNVAFGGANLDQLFVTGALGKEGQSEGALFRLDLKGIRGLPLLQR